MTTRTAVGTAMTITALAATLAGCGGGSKALSRSQLDAKANAICATSNTKIAAVKQPASFQDANVAAAYFDQIEPIIASASSKLDALKPDSDVSADWKSYTNLRAQGLTLLQTIKHKADTKDSTGLQDLAKEPAIQAKIVAAAQKVGATSCTQ